MTPRRPLLPALPRSLGRCPPSAMGLALTTMAQKLDPDAPAMANNGRTIILRIRCDSEKPDAEPEEWGAQYAIVLPEKAPSADAWYRHVQQRFRHQLLPPGATS